MKNPFPQLLAAARQMFASTSSRPAPAARGPVLGARHEPPNISATAKAADIQGAIREAELGDTQALFRFYRDVLIGDDLIQGELNKRKLAVIGQPTTLLSPMTCIHMSRCCVESMEVGNGSKNQ